MIGFVKSILLLELIDELPISPFQPALFKLLGQDLFIIPNSLFKSPYVDWYHGVDIGKSGNDIAYVFEKEGF